MNQHNKRNANKDKIPSDKKELSENTEDYIRDLTADPEMIATFFQHQSVQYAARLSGYSPGE